MTTNNAASASPLVLCILDGWGIAQNRPDNAIAQAHTPHFDHLLTQYPHSMIDASGPNVGLPEGQMGNSEVGHMAIGCGRTVLQDLPRIDAAFAKTRALEDYPALVEAVRVAKEQHGRIHLLGLLSDGGVHSHIRHLLAMIDILAPTNIEIAIHAFLDGRDTLPSSAHLYLAQLAAHIQPHPQIRLATISGRFYAMDRDSRYDRTALAYAAIAHGHGQDFTGAIPNNIDTLFLDPKRGIVTDEFVLPTILPWYEGVRPGDVPIMLNFRADRVRQLLESLLHPDFTGFPRSQNPKNTPPFNTSLNREKSGNTDTATAIGMVEYGTRLTPYLRTLFPSEAVPDSFGAVLARHGKTQLRIAETEKYAHVTFFFSGGQEAPFPGEERYLIPSPTVRTYDEQPEMSAHLITDHLIRAIREARHDVIIVNYANADMVGHTGNFAATCQAIETLDQCLGKVQEAVLAGGGMLLITADHGNAEQMMADHTVGVGGGEAKNEGKEEHSGEGGGGNHTSHTTNPVPCLLVSARHPSSSTRLRAGRLSDIAPTLLSLLALPCPEAMTGRSLIDMV